MGDRRSHACILRHGPSFPLLFATAVPPPLIPAQALECAHLRVVPAVEPGPNIRAFTPVFDGLCSRSPSRGHGVWVPAFAGTTLGQLLTAQSTTRPLAPCPPLRPVQSGRWPAC